MSSEKYWPEETGSIDFVLKGVVFSLRATFAYELIKHFGSIAGKLGPEDKSGRASIILQEPKELVDRCFQIADLFVEKAEKLGEIKRPDFDYGECQLLIRAAKNITKELEKKENES